MIDSCALPGSENVAEDDQQTTAKELSTGMAKFAEVFLGNARVQKRRRFNRARYRRTAPTTPRSLSICKT